MIVLGTPVVYHHRAAVARYGPPELTNKTWRLTEGVSEKTIRPDMGYVHETDLFQNNPQQGTERNWINKTVMVWPEEGSGVVTGMIRRMKGISRPGYGRGGSLYGTYEDYEPGYFEAKEAFDLYVIRHELKGQAYILVPMWAVQPMQLGEAK